MKGYKKVKVLLYLCAVMIFACISAPRAKAADIQPIDGSAEGDYVYDMTELKGRAYIPVQMKNGGKSTLDISVSNAVNQMMILTLKAANVDNTDNWMQLAKTNTSVQWSNLLVEGSTYYLYLITTELDNHVTVRVHHTYTPGTGNATLKEGKWLHAIPVSNVQYYKFTLPKDGYITLDHEETLFDPALLDSKKKTLVKELSLSFSSCALKKGTYYLKFQYKRPLEYKIKYNFHALTPSAAGGKKISSAKKVKLGQKITVFYPVSSGNKSKYIYYKVKIPKKKKLSVVYEEIAGYISFSFYKKAGKKYSYLDDDYLDNYKPDLSSTKKRKIKVKKTLSPGTYYLVVVCSMKNNSGCYRFTLK